MLLVVALLAGVGGFGFYHMTQSADATTVADSGTETVRRASDVLGTVRPEFSLPDLAGDTRHVGEWDGDVILVNFWATWCPPCLKEMPAFVEMQETYGDQGLTILAVAIDE